MPALDCPLDSCPWTSQHLAVEFADGLNIALAQCQKCGQSFTTQDVQAMLQTRKNYTKNRTNLGSDESGIVANDGPDNSICASNHTHKSKDVTLHHHVFSDGSGW